MRYQPRFVRRDGNQFMVKLTLTPNQRERARGARRRTARYAGQYRGAWYSPTFQLADPETSGVLDTAVYSFLHKK